MAIFLYDFTVARPLRAIVKSVELYKDLFIFRVPVLLLGSVYFKEIIFRDNPRDIFRQVF